MIVDLVNDYAFKLDPRFACTPDQDRRTWGTVETCRNYVNFNVLTRHPVDAWSKPMPWPVPLREGLVYYGAHREGRVPSFVKYLANADYPVTISTFKGAAAFRVTCGQNARIIGAF